MKQSFFSVRGLLGSTIVLSCNCGMLIAFTLGSFNFYITPLFVIGLTVVYAFCIFSFPESPSFLMRQNKIAVSLSLHINIYCSINSFNKYVLFRRKQRGQFDFIKIWTEWEMTLNYYNWKCRSWKIPWAITMRKVSEVRLIGRIWLEHLAERPWPLALFWLHWTNFAAVLLCLITRPTSSRKPVRNHCNYSNILSTDTVY